MDPTTRPATNGLAPLRGMAARTHHRCRLPGTLGHHQPQPDRRRPGQHRKERPREARAGRSRTRRSPGRNHHHDSTDRRRAVGGGRQERNPTMTSRKQRRAMAAWASHARETSCHAARQLALAIVHDFSPDVPTYDLGIVLGDDETAWQRAPADYSWRGEHSWVVQHNSYWGYRSTLSEVHQPCMIHVGFLNWLITN